MLSLCRSHRFANPAKLNAAAGWLFVNGPEDVQYLCSTNVRNYQRRYLPGVIALAQDHPASMHCSCQHKFVMQHDVKVWGSDSACQCHCQTQTLASQRSAGVHNNVFSTGFADIYKWVTHEKGILGSQDDYNARHRRLCQPPFRSKSVLNRFSGVISKRCGDSSDGTNQLMHPCC